MFGLTFIGDVCVLVGGIALGILYETKIKAWIMGAETFAKSLEAKAAAIKAAVK